MPRHPRYRALLIGLCLAGSTGTWLERSAAAQSTDARAEARTQFQQALALQAAGDWVGALALLERVAAVAPTSQVRFNIGLCQEHLGRLSAALGNYRIAAKLAAQGKIADVEKQATEHAADVEARMPAIRIVRDRPAETARIFLDGTELGGSALDRALPLDPGAHQLETRPASGAPNVVSFNLAEREQRSITASLGTPASETPAPAKNVLPTTTGPAPRPTSRVYPLIIGGAGVLSLGAALVFELLRKGAVDDLEAICGPQRQSCPPSARDMLDDARTYMTAARVTAIVGILAVGVGATWFLLTPSSDAASARTVPPQRVRVLAGGSGVGLRF